ncbi:S-layer protein [Acidovorax sp. NCPPB 3576]|uniref:S-layer protein n=1 Tax=Acidovorax sp. NCPPB 3576 TaxID=2940488 RepID=UPI002349AC86|nr:S-layer protein [Acidovorax sp. NCPPB 3576]WCM88044.1 S-layer protein [Acidovorax sp. NCPPB 3576]
MTRSSAFAPNTFRRARMPLAIALALPALLLAGCGGSGDGTPAAEQGRWTTGDLHTHTVQSDDSRTTQTLDFLLGKAFTTYRLDWMAVTNHLRSSKYDHAANLLPAPRAFAYGMEAYEIPRIQALQASGNYAGKLIFSGFEWDMPTHDHIGVGLFEGSSGSLKTSASGAKEFQYLFTTGAESLFDAADVARWKAQYPQRFNQTADDALKAIAWLKAKYPDTSYALINHPSRNPGKYSIADLRQMNDLAPKIVFAIEGMVGNQLEPDRGGYTSAYIDANQPNRTYGGTDAIVAQLGGVWDALLGEGRRIWNIADSDSHFEIDSNNNSSGYYPGEYAKNHVWQASKAEGGIGGLVDSLRAGRSFGVFGDLINALDFNVYALSGKGTLGQEVKAAAGESVTVRIRFKSPPVNNYQRPVASGNLGNMTPKVDHIDLIAGDVGERAQPGSAAYQQATNPTTRVVRRFTAADWTQDGEGYYAMEIPLTIAKNQYLRLRGTNLGENVAGLTANGEPLADQAVTTSDPAQRHDQINDRNYGNLWFYSNPIFVSVR